MEARLLLLMAVFTLLVSGESKAAMGVVVAVQHPPSNMQENPRKKLASPSSPPPWSQSFNALFASKRKVPNTWDPLHNRWIESSLSLSLWLFESIERNWIASVWLFWSKWWCWLYWETWPRGLLVWLRSFSSWIRTPTRSQPFSGCNLYGEMHPSIHPLFFFFQNYFCKIQLNIELFHVYHIYFSASSKSMCGVAMVFSGLQNSLSFWSR